MLVSIGAIYKVNVDNFFKDRITTLIQFLLLQYKLYLLFTSSYNFENKKRPSCTTFVDIFLVLMCATLNGLFNVILYATLSVPGRTVRSSGFRSVSKCCVRIERIEKRFCLDSISTAMTIDQEMETPL